MTKPRILPCRYYEHAAIGCMALASLRIGPAQLTAGLSHMAFLAAQMEATTTLDIMTLAATKNAARPGKKWQRTFTCVPSFCWVKLIANEWVVPTVCTLGMYPATTNVAKLASYYRTLDEHSFSMYCSHLRKGESVLHITGMNRLACYQAEDCLWDLGGVVRSWYPPPPPGPQEQDCCMTGTPARHGQNAPPPRRGISAASPGHSPRRAASPAHYAPYAPPRPTTKNPEYTLQVWQKASWDKFDMATDALRDLLCSTPRVTTDSIWQTFLSWLTGLQTDPGFNRTATIPIMEAKFAEILQGTVAATKSADALEANINERTKELTSTVK